MSDPKDKDKEREQEEPTEEELDFMPKWGSGDKPITTCKTCGGHGSYGYGNPCPECGAV